MANVIISIDSEGAATYLVNEHTRDLFPDAAMPRRASHVVPMDPCLRILFQTLRAVCSDDSEAAKWTRTWGCRWQVDLSPVNGPCYLGFLNRDEAIEFEIGWLN